MNAFKMTKRVLLEAMERGNFEITGILETGELTIAIVSDLERTVLRRIVNSPREEALESLVKLSEVTVNETREIYEAYEQLVVNKKADDVMVERDSKEVWWKNQLRLRKHV